MVDIDKIIKKSYHSRRFPVFVSFLCVSVFIISIYILIRPAQSMINDTECSMTEHTHTDECYTVCNEPEKKFLSCEYHNYENIIHIHDSFCYDEKNILICPLEEITHEHESSCYNDNGELICNAIVHQHNEDCFKISNGEDYRILSCGIEKHSCTKNCTENVVMCSSEETTHEHESSCYNDNGELICNAIVQQPDEDCSGIPDIVEATVSAYENEENCHTETCYELVTDLPPPDNTNENETETIYEDYNSGDTSFSIVYQAVSINDAENTETVNTAKALNLENKLNSVIMNYQSADGTWNTINDPTQGSYPPDKSYRFRFEYGKTEEKQILTADLISKHDCMLIIPDCIPHWLNVQQEGIIMYNSQPAGKIKVTDGSSGSTYKSVVIIFEKTFLENQCNIGNLTMQGNFYILGSVLLDKLTDENRGELSSAIMGQSYIQFEEGNLFEKYGRLDIIKREMGVVSDADGDYIKYQLVLQSLSSDADIPNVNVKDVFTGNTTNFVEEYAGVPVNTLSETPSGKNSYEVIEYNDGTSCADAEHGSISYDSISKKMTWNIKELKAGTTRYLTYYVKTDPYYMGSVSRGELVNNVKVYSNNTLKDEAEAVFIPQTSVSVGKKETKFDLNDYGTGYLTYEIKITGNKKNSYDLVNIRLHDYLVLRDITGNDIHNAKSVITFDRVISAVSSKNRTVSITPMEDKDLTNAAFDFEIDKLSPGETITITYTVKVENLYVYINGYCELSNHAEIFSENNPERGNASNYLFAASYVKHTFTKYNWMRKLQGKDLTDEKNITIGDNVFAYSNTGSIISETPAEKTFTAPVGSKRYTVYLNEQGLWDLSSTNLSDSFTAGNGTKEGEKDHIQYKGYLEIQQYDLKINGSETEVESAMNGTSPEKTVWLNIDGRTSFSFTPEQLGFAEQEIDHKKCYSYRLIYYAVPVNIDGVGQVAIANEFYASGDIGVNGTPVKLLGLKVSVSGIIQGNIHYNATKEAWYFDSNDETAEKAGSIYWVIRLDGTIPAGLTFEDYETVHKPGGSVGVMNQYRIKGVYRCLSNVNPLSYKTYDEFVNKEVSEANTLRGNDRHIQNCDASFSQLMNYNDKNNTDFDYVYGYYNCSGGKKLGISFQEDINLGNDKCLYIIVNTVARYSLLGTGQDTQFPGLNDASYAKIFENTLSVKDAKADKFVHISDATYIEKRTHTAIKEGVVAYMRDRNNWSLISTSDNDQANNKNLYNGKGKIYWHQDDLDEQGVYAEWILNINWDGSLEGTADVYDILPEGFEPVYLDCSRGLSQEKSNPEFYTVPELDASNEWKKVNFYHHNHSKVKFKDTDGDVLTKETGKIYYSGANSPVYYNPETHTVRIRVGKLEASEYVYNGRVGFVLICKITDPEILLTDSNLKREQSTDANTAGNYIIGGTVFTNEIKVIGKNGGDTIEATASSTITIDTRGSIIKSFAEDNLENTIVDDRTDSYTSTSLYQQFKIVVNPLEYDLSTDSTGMLPPLIDKIDGNLTFLTEDENEGNTIHKGGVEIKYADGTSVDGYTVQFKKATNELVINNLPANKKIIITYWTKINASDLSQGIQIKNTAYWLGYADESDDTLAQVNVIYNYDSGGSIAFTNYPKIIITKADSSNLNKKLSGAKFGLYKVENGQPAEQIGEIKTTGADGKLTFEASADVTYDKVYCIKETSAPDGYRLDETPHYFAVQNYTITEDKKFEYNPLNLCGVDRSKVNICYNSNGYYVTLFNNKEPNEITVTKQFQNPEGQDIIYYEGEYRFGIYSSNSDSPLQILSIIYDVNGEPSYKLDNMPVDDPVFTCAEPEMLYNIYELDDKNRPLREGSYLTVNGSTYLVSYERSSNIATVNDEYNDFKVTNKMIVFDMPETGGIGLKNYYIYALSGLAFTLLIFALFRKVKS